MQLALKATHINCVYVCVSVCLGIFSCVICSLFKILTNAVDAIAVAVAGVQCNSLMNCELLKSMNDPVQIRN